MNKRRFMKQNILHFIFITLIAFIAVFNTQSAKAQNVYTVENVKVDISADNPVSAREQAFQQAQRKAFLALSGSLGKEGAENIDTATLSSLIKDFEIVDEKLAPNRYAATFIFRFNRNQTEQYFASYQPPALTPEMPLTPPVAGGFDHVDDYTQYSPNTYPNMPQQGQPYNYQPPQQQYGQQPVPQQQGQQPVYPNQNPDLAQGTTPHMDPNTMDQNLEDLSYSELFARDNAHTQNMNQQILNGTRPTPSANQQPQYTQRAPTQQAAPQNQSVLLLPYWRSGDNVMLWGSQNAWMKTWKKLENISANKFVLPLGDLTDMQQIGDQLPEDPLMLQTLLARYNVSQAVIAVGQYAPRSITTALYTATPQGLKFWQVIDSPFGPQTDLHSIAAGEVLKEMGTLGLHNPQQAPLANDYAQTQHMQTHGNAAAPPYYQQNSADRPVVPNQNDQFITVEGRFENAREWLQMKTLLDQINGIETIEILSLKPQSVMMNMELSQPVSSVQNALYSYKLDLGSNPQIPAMQNHNAEYYIRFRMNGV